MELMVVSAIIGIMAGLGLVIFRTAADREAVRGATTELVDILNHTRVVARNAGGMVGSLRVTNVNCPAAFFPAEGAQTLFYPGIRIDGRSPIGRDGNGARTSVTFVDAIDVDLPLVDGRPPTYRATCRRRDLGDTSGGRFRFVQGQSLIPTTPNEGPAFTNDIMELTYDGRGFPRNRVGAVLAVGEDGRDSLIDTVVVLDSGFACVSQGADRIAVCN